MEIYLCRYTHGEPYIPHDTMVEKMAELTSIYSSVHGVVDDNSNPHKNIVIDAMRMNQSHAGQFSIIDEEPNVETIKFFDFLKDSDKPL